MASGAALALAASAPSDRTSLTAFACRRALEPDRRTVSVTAVMRPVPGTQRLTMRFELFGVGGGRTTPVRGGDLGTWLAPNPPTLGQLPDDVWIVHHPVKGVPVPALYHFRVAFRWMGTGSRILATAVRVSDNCWQPDMRPQLEVESTSAEPVGNGSGQDAYTAQIANTGLTAAKAVQVVFTPVGGPTQSVTLPQLGPQEQRTVQFTGPACTAASGAPTVAVDPNHKINQRPGGASSMTATCPTQTPSSSR